jgi:predicted double-glycine peptidase
VAGASRIAVAPSGVSGALGPLINIPQTWNNCGPASIAEVLSYWGIYKTQGEIQAVLRVDGPSRGMMSYGVPAYARSLGMRALVGVGGTEALIKALISNNLPVIVSQEVSVSDHIGHYRPIESYDDRRGIFVSSDPYLGQGTAISYVDFRQIWQRSGEGFIVLYPPSRQAKLAAVLAAAGWNKTRAYQADLVRLQKRRYFAFPSQQGATGASPHGFARYRYLGLAWDEVQLGRYAAAGQLLQQAAQQGANPAYIRWIAGEIGQ